MVLNMDNKLITEKQTRLIIEFIDSKLGVSGTLIFENVTNEEVNGAFDRMYGINSNDFEIRDVSLKQDEFISVEYLTDTESLR